jgi:hypothetical protein
MSNIASLVAEMNSDNVGTKRKRAVSTSGLESNEKKHEGGKEDNEEMAGKAAKVPSKEGEGESEKSEGKENADSPCEGTEAVVLPPD